MARRCRKASVGLAALLPPLILYLLQPPQTDEVTEICYYGSLFKDTDIAFQIATEDRVQAWVEACQAVLPSLHFASFTHLRYALRAGQLPSRLGLSGDKLREALPVPKGDALACGRGYERKGEDSLQRWDRHHYRAAGVWPLQEPTIAAEEVKGAFERAEVAKFDATRVLPMEFFNISLDGLCKLHPGRCGRIPVLVGHGWASDGSDGKNNRYCHEWLTYLTHTIPSWGPLSLRAKVARRLVPLLLKHYCPNPARSLQTLGKRSRAFHKQDYPWSGFVDLKPQALEFGRRLKRLKEDFEDLRFASLNLQRVPNFAKDVNFPRAFNLSEEVESAHSLLWFGQSSGDTHLDYHDNVVIQLTGRDEIVIFPANCTALSKGMGANGEVRKFVMQGMPRGEVRVPFFHITLHAGEGVAIPSMAHHKVVSRRSGRVAVNAFFEPRWGRMQWRDAPAHFYRRQDKIAAALRILWIRGAKRLWQSKEMTLFMHTAQNDFF